MQSRNLMPLTARTFVAAPTSAVQPSAQSPNFSTSAITQDCVHANHTKHGFGFRRAVRALALSILGLVVVAHPAMAQKSGHTMKGFVLRGPQAVPSGAVSDTAGPQYGLFTCQIVGLRASNCIDPYEMRHAYQMDSLIAEGYDGSGQTIVILDAFQNPNLVAQVATFDTFYGLPAIQLTQIAPDGLTPFDQNDPNMVGWAEEISLDVEWSHAIAPGANIVLVLAKSR